jgi:hypothetical protein
VPVFSVTIDGDDVLVDVAHPAAEAAAAQTKEN